MDLSFSPEEQAFRAEVRARIAAALPDDLAAKARASAQFSHGEIMRWHRILAGLGWAAPHWPTAGDD